MKDPGGLLDLFMPDLLQTQTKADWIKAKGRFVV